MPDWKAEIRQRLAGLQLAPGREAEIVEELAQHLDDRHQELLAGGATSAAARRAALAELMDGEVLARELRRAVRPAYREPALLGAGKTRGNLMENLWHDLRYSFRSLRKNPGFTVVAVLALAVGIGANSAIFSVVNGILLRPLPYKDPQDLVVIWETREPLQKQTGASQFPVAAANFVDWRSQNQVFEQVAAFHSQPLNLTGGGEPERLSTVRASADLFPLLGVQPLHGRGLQAEDDRPEAARVAVLSYGFWQRRFAGDPKVIDQSLRLEENTYTIVGVMPPGFRFPDKNDFPAGFQFAEQVDVWMPLALTAQQAQNRGRHYMVATARLKPGVTLEQAQADLDIIADRLQRDYPEANTGAGVSLMPLHQQIVGKIKTALWVLLGAVSFVLLIACANVANLLLARSSGRQKEIAIRTALGASRNRVVRQLLTESLLLSGLGGVVGLLLAFGGVKLLLAISPANIPRASAIGVDWRVLTFTLLVSLLTGVIFGLAPAFQASKPDLNDALKENSGRASGGLQRNRVRSLLVIGEVALAFVLLIGAGLMIRSFQQVLQIDPGFQPENVLTMNVTLTRSKYPESPQRSAFFKQVVERLNGLPGVRSAAAIYPLPLGGAEEGSGFGIEGEPPRQPGERRSIGPRWITSDYFKTMGIPLREGRFFDERDSESAPQVALINEAAGHRFFPNDNPVGKRIAIGMEGRPDAPNWRQIVGIVGDVKHTTLEGNAKEELYLPHTQFPIWMMTLVVRTDGEPLNLTGAIRSQIWAIDNEQPITHVRPMDELLSDALAERRFTFVLFGVFAGVALVLASIGIYGVMSYSVTQRAHEMGIRLALGAQPRDVLRLVMRQGLALSVIGVGAGLGSALLLTRVLATLLYGVSATDTLTFVSLAFLLIAVALFASYLPARRATKVDPLVALRYE